MKEFTKLERIEIGGLKGRSLSNKIIRIYREFTENFTLFATRTYDVLDPEDMNFVNDYLQFQKHIDNLDRQLASVLCQAFDECCNLDSVFKVNILYCIPTDLRYRMSNIQFLNMLFSAYRCYRICYGKATRKGGNIEKVL